MLWWYGCDWEHRIEAYEKILWMICRHGKQPYEVVQHWKLSECRERLRVLGLVVEMEHRKSPG